MRAAAKLGVALAVGGAAVYAGLSIYAGQRITKRRLLLPGVTPDTIAPNSEDVNFFSRGDRVRLRGWWFPCGGGERALILVHGHGQNRIDKNWGSDRIAQAFLARGYSVLLFDLRGHGESAPSRQSYGVTEKNDVLGALDYVRGRGIAPARIAMIGVSYGAATMLMAAPEMPEVGALVADSGYAEIWPVIAAEIPRQNRLAGRIPLGIGIRLASRLQHRINLSAARPIAAVELLRARPILFIHGTVDTYIPPAHSRRMFAAHGHRQSELWLVPGADHAQSYMAAPDEFIERVETFLEKQLGTASV